jgi:hypothetical protein
MIHISEKDLLFGIINIVGAMSYAAYIGLDFIAVMAQVMAAADPQYAPIEVGFSMLRAIAYVLIVTVGMLVLACDLWWGYRIWKKETRAYWRENL